MTYIMVSVLVTSISWGSFVLQPILRSATHNELTVQNVLYLMNKDRISNGEPPLQENTYLDSVADYKAQNMADSHLFSHIDSAGHKTFDYEQGFTDMGENLAESFNNAVIQEDAWMNSPEHRVNLLNPVYSQVGISIKDAEEQGEIIHYVAVEFGN